MIITLFALIIPMFLLFFVDLDIYLMTTTYLYACVVLYKISASKKLLIDSILLSLYFCLMMLNKISSFSDLIPYMGSLIYFVLSVYFALCIFMRKIYKSKINRLENILLNIFLTGANIISLILSIQLFPKMAYIIIPLVISLLSIPFSIFLPSIIIKLAGFCKSKILLDKEQLTNMNAIFGNLNGFYHISGNYYTKEVYTEKEKEIFLDILKQGYTKIYQNSSNKTGVEKFFDDIKTEYEKYQNNSDAFIVYDNLNKKFIGCLRFVKGTKSNRLPMENYINIKIKNKYINEVCEIGRLSINSNPIENAKVMQQLLFIAMSKILFNKVKYIITDALINVLPIYTKLGMQIIGNEHFDHEFNQKSYICGITTEKIFFNSEKSPCEKECKEKVVQFVLKKLRNRKHTNTNITEIIEGETE